MRCDASDRALAVDHVGGAKDEENEENAENAGASLGDSGSRPRSFVDGAFAAAERPPREFAEGEALVTQGTPADAAYLVLEGAAELVLERVVATDEGEETVTRASSRTVGAGEFVGEAAMLDGERTYGASAVATRRTVAIEVRKEEFAAALAAASEEDRARVKRVAADRRALLREMSAKLRTELGAERASEPRGSSPSTPAAQTLPETASAPMLPETSAREFRSWRCAEGTIIAARGEMATAAYFLKSGAARETLALDDDTSLATFAAGDFLGYSSIALRRQRRLSTFVATRACELLVVPREAFVDLVAATPGLGERMVAHGERVHAELRERIAARLGRGVSKIVSAGRLAAAGDVAGTAKEGTGRERERDGDGEDAKGSGPSRFAREASVGS